MPRKKKFKPNYPDLNWTDEKCKWHFRTTEPLFSSMREGIASLNDMCCCIHLLKSHHISVVIVEAPWVEADVTHQYPGMVSKKFFFGKCLKKACKCVQFETDNLQYLLNQGKQNAPIDV